MKNNSLKIKDFEIEKISTEAQKVIKGGDGESVDPQRQSKLKVRGRKRKMVNLIYNSVNNN
ncbi:hypothetical protein [Flavobacterium sp. CGRL2]